MKSPKSVYIYVINFHLKTTNKQISLNQQVMEVLAHINKRIKSRPRIQLPVDNLLVQYQVRIFSFLLILTMFSNHTSLENIIFITHSLNCGLYRVENGKMYIHEFILFACIVYNLCVCVCVFDSLCVYVYLCVCL